jgi:hypothetical protein
MTTYIQAKKIAATGAWNDAWDFAKADPSLNSGVKKELWVTSVANTLNAEAKLQKSSVFHKNKINELYKHMDMKGWVDGKILLEHMCIVADNDVDQEKQFKKHFDDVLNNYCTIKFREVATLFGDYWHDITFSNSIDAIDASFASIS